MKKVIIALAVLVSIAAGLQIAVCSWIHQSEDRFRAYDDHIDRQKGQIRDLQIRCDRTESRVPLPSPEVIIPVKPEE
jgi:hypothetical protein